MSAYVPVSSTQIFDFNTLVNGFLQTNTGALDSSNGSGYTVSAGMQVMPGAHLTWASPATAPPGDGAGLFGNGYYCAFAFYSDAALTTLVGVDTTSISATQANNYTTTVPAGAHYARAEFNIDPPHLVEYLQGGTITTDTPLPVAPTITFAIPNHATTDAPFTVAATSNSAGALSYGIVSGPATSSGSVGNLITLTGSTGTVVVQAAQAAATGYTAATQPASFTVSPPVTPTLSFAIPSHTYGDPPFIVAASSNSPGVITYSVVSGPATVSGNSVTVTGAGTVVVRASQAAGGGYSAFSTTAAFSASAPTPAGYVALTALNFQDAAHNPLPAGWLAIQPTDGNDRPISATAGGVGGLICDIPVRIPITGGAIPPLVVADTTMTRPPNISYRLSVLDSSGATLNVIKGFQPSGSAPISLDTFQPPSTSAAPYTPGLAASVAVGAVTTLAAGSSPTVTNSGSSSAAVLNFGLPAAPASSSAVAGKKLAVFGDSISAIFQNQWQNVVSARLGLVQTFQDARPGRRIDQIFECYGAPSGGAISTNQGSVSTPNGNTANNGTPGHTLAQDLAACDFCVVFLGMNDQNVTNGGTYLGPGSTPTSGSTGTLGSLSDSSSALTEYGFIRRAAETILGAAPTLRLVFVFPYQAASSWMTAPAAQTLLTAYTQVAAAYNCPVINLLPCNITPLNHSLTLQGDGIHPSTLGFSKFVGPSIAQGLQALL